MWTKCKSYVISMVLLTVRGMTINRTGPHRAAPDRTEALTYLLTYT